MLRLSIIDTNQELLKLSEFCENHTHIKNLTVLRVPKELPEIRKRRVPRKKNKKNYFMKNRSYGNKEREPTNCCLSEKNVCRNGHFPEKIKLFLFRKNIKHRYTKQNSLLLFQNYNYQNSKGNIGNIVLWCSLFFL